MKPTKKSLLDTKIPTQEGMGQLLDMNEASTTLKTTRATFYRWVRAGKLTGTKVGRQWRFQRSEIERFAKGETAQIDLPADITPLIKALCIYLGQPDNVELPDGKLPRAVSLMIQVALKPGGHSLHVEPRADHAVVRCRRDGIHHVANFDMRLLPALIRQWKTMANCDVHETVRPQEGRIVVQHGPAKKKFELRLCFCPAALGEALTVNVIDQEVANISLDLFDFAASDKKKILKSLAAPWGVVIVAGPPGCGKTSTLYACLNQITSVSSQLKIMTIEDPVGYFLPGTTQVSVRPQIDLSFASLLRTVLRSDPDVVMVSQIPDAETLLLSLQATLTGHLVLSTLHTSEAATTLKRLIDLGASPFVVADATKLIVAQRLVRKLCPECSVARQPAKHFLDLAQQLSELSGADWKASPKTTFREPVGCKKCNMTGFRGRAIIAELLEITPKISDALISGASVPELRALAVSDGMTTMVVDGLRRAAKGQTSLGEAITTTSPIYLAELSKL